MSIVEQLASEIGISASALATQLQQTTAPEQLDPNYLTFDPTTGLVGANFTGKISAQELVLPASNSSPATVDSQVRWQRKSDAAEVAQIDAFTGGGSEVLELFALPIGATDGSSIGLAALDQNGLVAAALRVSLPPNSTSGEVVVSAKNGGQQTLLNSAGASTFLQLLSAQKLQFAHGTTTVTFTASANTPEVTVAHGLGGAPDAIVCPVDAGSAHRITAQIDSLDATNLKISGWADANISQTVTVAWFAVA